MKIKKRKQKNEIKKPKSKNKIKNVFCLNSAGYNIYNVFCQKKAIEGSTNVFDWSDFFHSLLLHKTSLLLEIHWDCPQCLLVMDREEVLSLGGDGLEDELGVS